MKRTKLTSSSLPPGSIPLTSSWYEVPRCFACDDPIKSHRFSTSLLLGHTQYTHSSIPGKLGEYIGDGFVVIVTSDDALCRTCMNLLNTMDRLEQELKDHRTRLVGNLRRKYGLDGENRATKLSKTKLPKEEYEDEADVEVISDEEWTPNNKKRKTPSSNSSRVKTHSCSMCKVEFTDLSLFLAHLRTHNERKDGSVGPKETKLESEIPKSFKCGCCTLSFDRKEALAVHMRVHTTDKQPVRPLNVPAFRNTSLNDGVSMLKSGFSSLCSPGNTLHNDSQTVVEMKLIMEQDSNSASKSLLSNKTRQAEGSIRVSQTTAEKDSGGKVCLLALWNNGTCTEHLECQKSSSFSQQSNPTGNRDTQTNLFSPKVIVQQAQDGNPQVVVSSCELNVSEASQNFPVDCISSHEPKSQYSGTSLVTSSQTLENLPGVHIDTNDSGQVVVTIPSSSSGTYTYNENQNTLKKPAPCTKGQFQNCSESNNNSASLLLQKENSVSELQNAGSQANKPDKHSFDISRAGDQSCNNIENAQNSVNPVEAPVITLPSQSNNVTHIDETVASAIPTERTIVEHDSMGNIAIVNVTSVLGNPAVYETMDEVPDWFFNNGDSNVIIQTGKDTSLEFNEKTGSSSIDQIDGTRSTSRLSRLSFDGKEQNDSVDENEHSDFFTSRYVVDEEKIIKDVEAIADALLAAIGS